MKPSTFESIESPQFSARLMVASSIKMFTKMARQEKELRVLLISMPHDAPALFDRIQEIVGRHFDRDFCNPWDAAVAIYLNVLSEYAPTLASAAAGELKKLGGESWYWTALMVDYILGHHANHPTIAMGMDLPPSVVQPGGEGSVQD